MKKLLKLYNLIYYNKLKYDDYSINITIIFYLIKN